MQVYPPRYIPTLYHPGYTTVLHHQLWLGVTVTAGPGVEERRPWALVRRNPWVRRNNPAQDLKSVTLGGRLCAEFPALSR